MSKINESSKMTNKEKMNSLLNYIKELGYHPMNVEMSDGYLAPVEDCSIMEFTMKEFPKYKFGVWVTTGIDTAIQQIKDSAFSWADSLQIPIASELVLFVQHKWFIDKFKPSRGSWVTGLYRQRYKEEDDEVERWQSEYELADKLNFMKKHPIKAWYYISADIDDITGEVSGLKAFIELIKDYYSHYKYIITKKHKYKKNLKRVVKFMKKLTCFKYVITDRGSCWSPRIDILLMRKKDITYVDYMTELDLIEDLENNYFLEYDFQLCDSGYNEELEYRDLNDTYEKDLQDFKDMTNARIDDEEDIIVSDNL